MEFVIREKRTNYKISCLLGLGQGEVGGGADGFNIEEGLDRTFRVFLTPFGDCMGEFCNRTQLKCMSNKYP